MSVGQKSDAPPMAPTPCPGRDVRAAILRDLNQRYDYCEDQMMKVSNFIVLGNYAEASAQMEKMIQAANQCLHDMRILAQNTQTQQRP